MSEFTEPGWLVIKLVGVITVLTFGIFAYDHKRISAQSKRIDEVDKERQKSCVVIDQCNTNRDYQNKLFDKISEGQDRMEKTMVDGFKTVHLRVDDLYKKTLERREGDK